MRPMEHFAYLSKNLNNNPQLWPNTVYTFFIFACNKICENGENG